MTRGAAFGLCSFSARCFLYLSFVALPYLLHLRCVERHRERIKRAGIQGVVTGDQSNPLDLARWRRETGGGFDFIVDDGGHTSQQQWATLVGLWPALRPGGKLVVEDMGMSRTSLYRRDANEGHRHDATDATGSGRWASRAAGGGDGRLPGGKAAPSGSKAIKVPKGERPMLLTLPYRSISFGSLALLHILQTYLTASPLYLPEYSGERSMLELTQLLMADVVDYGNVYAARHNNRSGAPASRFHEEQTLPGLRECRKIPTLAACLP